MPLDEPFPVGAADGLLLTLVGLLLVGRLDEDDTFVVVVVGAMDDTAEFDVVEKFEEALEEFPPSTVGELAAPEEPLDFLPLPLDVELDLLGSCTLLLLVDVDTSPELVLT